MDVSAINSGSMSTMMIQTRQDIDSKMKDTINKVNADNGNILGVSADISRPSELLSKLEQLKNEDPEKFKDFMKDIAASLKAAADAADPESFQAKFLNAMSTKFASVAESGDLTQLQPPKPPPPPQGSDASKISQYSSTSASDDTTQTLLDALKSLLNAIAEQQNNSEDNASLAKSDGTGNQKTVQQLLTDVISKLNTIVESKS